MLGVRKLCRDTDAFNFRSLLQRCVIYIFGYSGKKKDTGEYFFNPTKNKGSVKLNLMPASKLQAQNRRFPS